MFDGFDYFFGIFREGIGKDLELHVEARVAGLGDAAVAGCGHGFFAFIAWVIGAIDIAIRIEAPLFGGGFEFRGDGPLVGLWFALVLAGAAFEGHAAGVIADFGDFRDFIG